MKITLVILASIGFTLIITRSYIFQKTRELISLWNEKLGELVNCSQCFGFWSGLLFALPLEDIWLLCTLPFVVSGLCYIITNFLEK